MSHGSEAELVRSKNVFSLLYSLSWPPFLSLLGHTSANPVVFGRWSPRLAGIILVYSAALALAGVGLAAVLRSVPFASRSWLEKAIVWTRRSASRQAAAIGVCLLMSALAVFAFALDVSLGWRRWLLIIDVAAVLVLFLGLVLVCDRDSRETVEVVGRLCLVGLGTFVAFGCIDLAGNLLDLEPREDWDINPRGLETDFVTEEFRSHVRTNDQGLREANHIEQRHPGVIRVIAVGDSFTFGWGVGDRETYPYQTSRILRDRYGRQDVEVVNLGRSGTGLVDYLRFVVHYAARLNPDVVVVGFLPGNDCPIAGRPRQRSAADVSAAVSNYAALARQVHPADPVARVLSRSFVFRRLYHRVYLPYRAGRPMAIGRSPDGGRNGPIHGESNPLGRELQAQIRLLDPDEVGAAQRRSAALEAQGWIRKGLDWSVSPWLIAGAILDPTGPADALFVRQETRSAMETEWHRCVGVLKEVEKATRDLRAELVILILPSGFQADSRVREFRKSLEYLVTKDMETDRSVNDRVLDFCRASGLTCIDTLDTFRQQEAYGRQLFYPIDGHLTPQGTLLVAELVAQGLLPLLSKSSRRGAGDPGDHLQGR